MRGFRYRQLPPTPRQGSATSSLAIIADARDRRQWVIEQFRVSQVIQATAHSSAAVKELPYSTVTDFAKLRG